MTVNIVRNYLNEAAFEIESVDALINSRNIADLGEMYIQSYYGGWQATVDGPKGGHYVHTTGGTASTPSVGPPVSVGTIGTGVQAGYYWDLDGIEWRLLHNGSLDVSAFGAILDGVTNDAPAWLNAIIFAQTNGNLPIYFYGPSLIESSLVIDTPLSIIGSGCMNDNTAERNPAFLIKGADVIAIEVTNSASTTLRDFGVVGSGSDTTQGIKLTQCGRTKLERISVMECGSHGIEINNGNLTSFRDLYVLNNGGDGLLINGATTPDTNALVINNVDARANTGVGINFDNGWNIMGTGLSAQQNTGAGVRLNNCRGSHLQIYGEANATNLDIELTNNANCEGNIIYALFYNGYTDNSAGQNIIFEAKRGADTVAAFARMRAYAYASYQNPGIAGVWDLDQLVAAQHRWFFSATSQAQILRLKNVGGLATPDTDPAVFPLALSFEGAVVERQRLIFTNLDTTPDVSLSEFWLANNTGATTITTFNGGRNGQTIHIVANNGNTTLQHSAVTSGLRLQSGANKTLGQYEGITFIKNGTDWWVEV